MISVNERSRLPITWRSLTSANTAIAPTTLRYRVDCESTGRTLLDWTSVDPASVVSIVVPASVNAIQNRANAAELKTLTVQVDEGTDNELSFDYTWRVRNLHGVS